jgi:uncharacterized protein YciI
MKPCLLALALVITIPAAAPAAVQSPTQETAGARQLFLFLFRPGPNWREGVPMRQQNLREHAAYHDRLVREGRGFAGGGYVGMDGGMAIVRAADRAEAEAILAADPAILNGVFAAELREWRPRFHTDVPLVERAE